MTTTEQTTRARRPRVRAAALTSLVALVAAALPSVTAHADSPSHRSHSNHDHHDRGSDSDEGSDPPPGGPSNLLTSADGTLHTGVGIYDDCSGASPVPQGEADVDSCVRGRTYFVGHNPGVFHPLMHMKAGSLLTWYDQDGYVHHYRVVAVRDTPGGARPLTTSTGQVAAQFQTCAVGDGSVNRILDAADADRSDAADGGHGDGGDG